MDVVAPANVPQISISPPPPEEPLPEPYSPFARTFTFADDDDAFRPQHLTPPPTHTRFAKQLSPLRPSEATVTGQGLERERFETLLQASKERNLLVGGKKTLDLRKEIALKAHKNKQVERRALFLSKVLAPPSPTATSTPKTPPESPAIFHYTLPSPGLVSPLALFESLNDDPSRMWPREPWVEQVDFRLPYDHTKSKKIAPSVRPPITVEPPHHLPSLDQISARLSSQRCVHTSSGREQVSRPARLPAFLAQTPVPAERPRLSIGVGRLRMPVRAPEPVKVETPHFLPPKSPMSPLAPELEVTTLVVSRSTTTSPIKLSESNLLALNSRERRAHDMLSTLRRRTLPSEPGIACHGADSEGVDDRRSKWKRHSAPADLTPLQPRTGFEHPILTLPGGF